MPAITNEKYASLLRDHGNCGLRVILPDFSVMALHEQNGGYSSLFNEDGEEVLTICPDGNIVDDDGAIICNFDSVEATGELAPWFIRNTDGDIVWKNID